MLLLILLSKCNCRAKWTALLLSLPDSNNWSGETSLPFSPDISPHRELGRGWGHTGRPPRSVFFSLPLVWDLFSRSSCDIPAGETREPLHRSIRLVRGSTAPAAATNNTIILEALVTLLEFPHQWELEYYSLQLVESTQSLRYFPPLTSHLLRETSLQLGNCKSPIWSAAVC